MGLARRTTGRGNARAHDNRQHRLLKTLQGLYLAAERLLVQNTPRMGRRVQPATYSRMKVPTRSSDAWHSLLKAPLWWHQLRLWGLLPQPASEPRHLLSSIACATASVTLAKSRVCTCEHMRALCVVHEFVELSPQFLPGCLFYCLFWWLSCRKCCTSGAIKSRNPRLQSMPRMGLTMQLCVCRRSLWAEQAYKANCPPTNIDVCHNLYGLLSHHL
jgi:hypothetical protein